MTTSELPTDTPPAGPSARAKAPVSPRRIIRHVVLLVAVVAALYPLLWLLSASFKSSGEIFTDPGLIPDTVQWDNYLRGWTALPQATFGIFFRNSLIVSLGCVLGNLLSCSIAAYAFARLQFPLRRVWFAIMLATLMLPYHVLVIPQYIIFQRLGWVDTFLPLIVPKLLATDAFFIFLMVQFIRGLPRELDQAAKIDGCGPFGIFFRVLLPLMKPALVTTALFTFLWTWDDFFSHLIYLNDISNFTVSRGLQSFLDSTSQSLYGPLFAMSVLSLVPTLVFFLFFQRQLVAGIATTGFK